VPFCHPTPSTGRCCRKPPRLPGPSRMAGPSDTRSPCGWMAEHWLARYRQGGLAGLARLNPSERPMLGVSCISFVATRTAGPVTLALGPLDGRTTQRGGAGFIHALLADHGRIVHAPAMFVVTEADAAAIRAAFHKEGGCRPSSSCGSASRASPTTHRREPAPGPSPVGSRRPRRRARRCRCALARDAGAALAVSEIAERFAWTAHRTGISPT